ncbi:hypothetical protein L1987_26609 [Smallanthus sonchifolius]|uniref:Uncharacterized protein n=1 Tax=Smallanthus sonchifolius TaxID=185202 RepID=A0ACB9IB60_9ASTR|nr:hypothetical protein L1987_26609 [Smallanthus sonchifolius]
MASSSPISSSSSIGSSSPINSCMQCQHSSSEPLMNGWQSRVGGYTQLCRSCYPHSVGIPLFEKLMSHSDAKLRHSRVVIPKTHAKAYFPEISEGQGVTLHVLDTDGKAWHFFYRCWVHKQYTTYVLQGLKEFMKSKNLKAGDTVAFYWRESDEKMILEVKKTSAGTSSHQAST